MLSSNCSPFFFLQFFLNCSEFTMLCQFLLFSEVIQLYVYTFPSSFTFGISQGVECVPVHHSWRLRVPNSRSSSSPPPLPLGSHKWSVLCI